MIIDILKKNAKKLKLNSNKSIYIFIQFYYNIKKLNLFRHASISCKMQSILIKNIPGRSWILRICYDDTLKKMFKPYVFYKLKSASNVQQLIVANAESETDIYDVENGSCIEADYFNKKLKKPKQLGYLSVFIQIRNKISK